MAGAEMGKIEPVCPPAALRKPQAAAHCGMGVGYFDQMVTRASCRSREPLAMALRFGCAQSWRRLCWPRQARAQRASRTRVIGC